MTFAGEVPLCSPCLRIFSSPTEPSDSFTKASHHSIASLNQAVEYGCPICAAVAAALPPEITSLSPDTNVTCFHITKDENKFRITVLIKVNDLNRPMFFNAVQGMPNPALYGELGDN